MIYEPCRSEHFLPGNKTTKTPSHWLFLDTETVPLIQDDNPRVEYHHFRLGVSIYVRLKGTEVVSRVVERHATRHSVWERLYRIVGRDRPLTIAAHNLRFDMGSLAIGREIDSGRLKFRTGSNGSREAACGDGGAKSASPRCAILDGPPTIIEGRSAKGNLTFLDSLNFFPISLARLGEQVGLHKFPMPSFDLSDEVWFRYCQRDVEILEKAMLLYIRTIHGWDLGSFGRTIAAQSWNAFRHRFMHQPIIIHGNAEALGLERKAYAGGRAENFFYGETKEPIFHLDVNSLYPFVMQFNRFPVQLLSLSAMAGKDSLHSMPATHGALATVKVSCSGDQYPAKIAGRRVYCQGEGVVTLAGPELMRALNRCQIVHLGRVAVYRVAYVFRSFVQFFLGYRDAHFHPKYGFHRDLAKNFMVSLYGKFAQRPTLWRAAEREFCEVEGCTYPTIERQTKRLVIKRNLFGETQEQYQGEEGSNTFPAIAAWVTSYARLHMDWLRSVAGRQQVYHQYIDSLVVSQTGLDNLLRAGCLHEDRPGSMRIVHAYQGGCFYGPGDYRLGEVSKICGIPSSARHLGKARYQWRRFFSGEIGRGNKGATGPLVETVAGVLNRVPPTDRLGPDGWLWPHEFAGS